MKGLAVVPILLILRNFLNNMVSIVICNRGNRISPVLEKNISETIGIEYEVVCIDNSKNQYNIFFLVYYACIFKIIGYSVSKIAGDQL